MIKFEKHDGMLFRMLEEREIMPLFEIIGTPVPEGSAEWALYQIRSGKNEVKERRREKGGGINELRRQRKNRREKMIEDEEKRRKGEEK